MGDWNIHPDVRVYRATWHGNPDAATELRGAMLFAVVFGLLIGAVFGAAQAWAFPGGGRRRLYWTISNTIGWALVLPMIYGAAQIATEVEGWFSKIAFWAVGGLAAGGLIGLATGVALLEMKRETLGQSDSPVQY